MTPRVALGSLHHTFIQCVCTCSQKYTHAHVHAGAHALQWVKENLRMVLEKLPTLIQVYVYVYIHIYIYTHTHISYTHSHTLYACTFTEIWDFHKDDNFKIDQGHKYKPTDKQVKTYTFPARQNGKIYIMLFDNDFLRHNIKDTMDTRKNQ